MHCTIEINQSALLSNATQFMKAVDPKRFAPVLKSNAYGHGLKEVYSILSKCDLEWICVNYLEEAVELRSFGYKKRILVVGPVLADEDYFATAQAHNVDINLSHKESVDCWLGVANPPRAHIKIDTGLSRQGFSLEQIPELSQNMRAQPLHQKAAVGLYTHFANVEDVLNFDFAFKQLHQLEKAVKSFATHKMVFEFVHAASSASTLLLEQSRFRLCRVGMSLYGHWPSDSTRLSYYQAHNEVFKLQPCLSWHSLVSAVKQVQAGDYIGYGCQYKVMRPMTVAVVPVGYYEGYPRLAGEHQSFVLIQGKRCMLLGRISMNMMVVDVSHLENIQEGAPVVLIGQQQGETITAEEVASWAQTIQYELLTRLNPKIPRVIVD